MIDGTQSGAASTVPMSRAKNAHDVIVIGAGLNGLTTAAYLARAGMSVFVLERRATLGGSAVTEEFAPGFSADICRHDIGAIAPRLVNDLDLERHGLKLVSRGAAIIARGLDDSVLEFGPNGPSLEGLRRLSPSDAAKWPKFAERVNALTGFLTRLYAAPVPGVDASSFTDIVAAAKLGLAFRGLGKRDMEAKVGMLLG